MLVNGSLGFKHMESWLLKIPIKLLPFTSAQLKWKNIYLYNINIKIGKTVLTSGLKTTKNMKKKYYK